MPILKMTDLELSGKRVLIREDLNVPIKEGKVSSDARLRAALPTLQLALKSGAKVIVMSHLGRPVEGEYNEKYSLAPVAAYLADILEKPVPLIKDGLDVPFSLESGQLVILENVRFNPGESQDDETLARKMADLCDIFVMDAFGTAHRAQASTHGVAKYAPIACAGPLLVNELEALEKALLSPARPTMAIVGGSKVSSKLEVLNALSTKCDQLIVGGGIANTFLAAAGFPIGKSLCEQDLIPVAKSLMERVQIPLPTDVVVATEFSEQAVACVKAVEEVGPEDMIMDIGPESAKRLAEMLKNAGTIIWNGPVGVFEFEQFSGGTRTISLAIAESNGFSIAGGGDTLAAIDQYDIADQLSYISTGGGAFLEFVEGKTLPAVAILQQRAIEKSAVE